MQSTTIITALADECRKSLHLLEALGAIRAADPARSPSDPLNGVVLRRRRSAAVLRSLLRSARAEQTMTPPLRPREVDAATVIDAEARLLTYLERQLARPDLPHDLHSLITEQREEVLQATLILSRLRDRDA